MKTIKTLVLFVFLLATGCASINQTLRTEIRQTNGVVEVRETTISAWVVGDAKQVAEKFRLSNGKTHSIGIASFGEESTTTNIGSNIRALTELLNTIKTP